ncbi:MAG: glycosyltransferase [Kiritimatiellae bacterium]|nr:glycosyltransferase [Kiritimatiellia bacterium]MDD5523060.1 glycosyltransferase [Kiritimatiellia bacterium]
MSSSPLVSVLMAVHNEDAFLEASIASILKQTFGDYEFIIVDDASSNERTRNILAKLKDDRVRLIRNDVNRGLAVSLNRGLGLACGKYIARMDADDVSLSVRLETQVEFLDRNPDVGIVGSAFQLIDADGRKGKFRFLPFTDTGVRWLGLLCNPFVHSTVMLRKQVLLSCDLKYDEACPLSQDYELWMRLLVHTRGVNIQRPLLMYRIHGGSIGSNRRAEQLAYHFVTTCRTIKEFLPHFNVSDETLKALQDIMAQGVSWRDQSERRRTELAMSYLEMLECFLQDYSQSQGITEARCLGIRTVLNVFVLPAPYFKDWMVVLRRILEIDPHLPFTIFRIVFNSGARHLRALLS